MSELAAFLAKEMVNALIPTAEPNFQWASN